MLRLRVLSAGPGEIATVDVISQPQPVPADPEEVRLLNAVSDAASDAATQIVFKGLVGFAGISVAGMIARKYSFGFLSSALLVSGVSFVATTTLTPPKRTGT